MTQRLRSLPTREVGGSVSSLSLISQVEMNFVSVKKILMLVCISTVEILECLVFADYM